MLMSPLRPLANISAVAPLTRMPAAATQISARESTSGGAPSRRAASHAIAPTATNNKVALSSAARIDDPPRP